MSDMTLMGSQTLALDAFRTFLQGDAQCFLLKGSAGTGKTTLIRAMVEHLQQMCRVYRALAPTGRAARILGTRLRDGASTVHGEIYTLEHVHVFEEACARNDPGVRFVFPLKDCDPGDAVFIVDESSMVGDKEHQQDVHQFGSGRLLADLIEYARLGRPGREAERRARIVLVGDPAQLPPVGDNQSPALSAAYIERTFGLRCEEFELTEVMRQASGSAVLARATALRDAIARRDYNTFSLREAPGEIAHVSPDAALERVVEDQRTRVSSVLVTRSNAKALELNRAARARLWGSEDPQPRTGDLLLVNKNSPFSGLMNGDLVRLLRVNPNPVVRHVPIRGIAQPVRLVFRETTLVYERADGRPIQADVLLLENLLDSPERELEPLEQRALLVDFRQRHPELRPGTAEFRVAIRHDPWFNALQVKYGYALTCHKAQGGEWDTVVVNFSDAGGDHRNEQFFRWAYTAITRARSKLLLIDPPAFTATSRLRFDAVAAPRTPAAASAATGTTHTTAADEPIADPDWDRFSFNPGQEPLFQHHRRIRETLAACGVRIVRLQHGQYFERYWLDRAGAQAVVQYHYKRDLRVSSIVAASGSKSDPALLQASLAQLHEVLQQPSALAAGTAEDAFLADFQAQVRQALEGTGLRITGVEPGSYKLRFTFEGAGRRGRVDFHYDGKKRWTRATEVGGPGSSQGIYQQVSQTLGMAQ
ncbi:AAA family ATPase [uncultured Azohydromonas sp.]|jgi:ATP-dependent exoDNAse (exonuclease V), alpha subunit - helicase superfamily I member|uniref:ATP-dependent DNA helicase n=1 Tax=uncultured Azohydromonas sp. TaxID=487342 RepID=UPI0026095A82|nr:AAA family ATPase [uncultured Azohydromonas sp.]